MPAARDRPILSTTKPADAEWKKLFDDYQAEHGAFTEEELAQARKDMHG